MALIECPHCGQKVSDTAETCIHCGNKFAVCPECGTVSAGELSACPNCGFAFIKQEEKAEAENTAVFGNDLFTKWKRTMPSFLFGKTVSVISKAMELCSILLLALACYLIWKWSNISDALEKLAEAKTLYNNVKIILVVDVISAIIGEVAVPIKELFLKKKCIDWIRRNKVDVIGYIGEHSNDYNSGDFYENYGIMAKCEYLRLRPQKRSFLLWTEIIYLVVFAVSVIIFGVAMQQIVEVGIKALFLNIKFKPDYTLSIVICVIGIVNIVVHLILESKFDKGFDIWLKGKLPDVTLL